jgi:hypothetical protein
VSKKESSTVKRAIKKAAKAKAKPKAAAPKGKGKTAASKAKGKAEAPIPTEAVPTAKGKAAAPKGAGKTAKGKTAAPKGAGKTAKGKAATPKGKGETAPAAGAVPPGEFRIGAWIDEHVTRAEAKGEPKRKNFVSNIHKRSLAAAELFGADPVQPITKRARDAAAEMHDGLHKKW